MLYARAMQAVKEDEIKRLISIAYTGASLQRAKKMPKLENLLKRVSAPKQGAPMSMQSFRDKLRAGTKYTPREG